MLSSPDYHAPKTLKEHFYTIICLFVFFTSSSFVFPITQYNQYIVLYLSTMLIIVFLEV